MSTAYYADFSLGLAPRVTMTTNPSEKQLNTFFGYSGVQSLWGGTRGRVFEVQAVFGGANIAAVVALRDALLAYDDGIARTLTDTAGTIWSNVVFSGAFQPTGPYLARGTLIYLPYRAVFEGRI